VGGDGDRVGGSLLDPVGTGRDRGHHPVDRPFAGELDPAQQGAQPEFGRGGDRRDGEGGEVAVEEALSDELRLSRAGPRDNVPVCPDPALSATSRRARRSSAWL
jgi:hypothetical protein